MIWTTRIAEQSDKSTIEALFLEMLRSIYGKEAEKGYEADYLLRFFGGEDRIYVAEAGGEVVGYLSVEVHREEQNFLYLDDFCVQASHRGQGIGTELLDLAEAYGIELGIGITVLHVEQSNEAARRLYERRGFALLAEEGSRLKLWKRA